MTRRALSVAYISNTRYAWCTEVHVARTLEQMGHKVRLLQEDRHTPESVERETKDFGADLLLYTRTWGMDSSLTDVWRRLEAEGTVTASLHLDLYLGLEREATLSGDPFWSTQYVFTPDGDPQSWETFAKMDINHRWSPPAVVRDECFMGRYSPHYATPVAFVGSDGRSYHQEWRWREQLQSWLAATYGDGYQRYGGGLEVVRGEHLNDLYRSVGVAVGDSLCPGFTKPLYCSDRLFEAGGRGAVQLFPRVPGIEDAFGLRDGEHLWYYNYGDLEAIRDRITWCLDYPDDARAMAQRGQDYIRAHHTYHHRLAGVLHQMGLRESPTLGEGE